MIDIPNGFYRISIKALILDEQQRFLLFLEENGIWELPGGGLDFGEDPQACLKRELKEEAGLDVTYVGTHPAYFVTGLNSKGQWRAAVLYETRVNDLQFTTSDECTAIKYFTKETAQHVPIYPTVQTFVSQFTPESHK
jgi:8-oxo-dGTP diphosphatase